MIKLLPDAVHSERLRQISHFQELLRQPYKVLIVDDKEVNRRLLAKQLERWNYYTTEARDGNEALSLFNETEFDLVLLDVMMPGLSGEDVLMRIKDDPVLGNIPVIIVTAIVDTQRAARCIEAGAEDYITKPINPTLLKARITSCLEKKRLQDWEQQYRRMIEMDNDSLAECVQEQVQQLTSAHLGMIFSMSKLAESRDPETGEHLERMREYCRLLAQELSRLREYADVIDQDFIDNIYASSPLHDIGKVGVPDHILTKPGKLNDEEWQVMKTHPIIGADTLRAVDEKHPGNTFIRMGIEIAEGHHERWDGSGYPRGVAGKNIPLPARILALGDVYDALTSKRCYKDALSHEESISIISKDSGKQFDPDIVNAFLTCNQQFLSIRKRFQDPELD